MNQTEKEKMRGGESTNAFADERREKQFVVVGLGEVLWDCLPAGRHLGGAPANFAYVSNQLGNRGIVASRAGDDADGHEIRRKLEECGVDVSHVQKDAKHPTGTVKVALEDGQPTYQITENAAWDFLELTADWRDLAKSCNAVCFGSLAQRSAVSRQTIREFLRLTRRAALRIFDVNLRQNFYSPEILRESLMSANVVKVNNEELPIICRMFDIEGGDEAERMKNLRETFNLRVACLTRGANGSLLIAEDEISENPGVKIQIADTIGAGDAFTAALADGILRDWSLNKINERANRVGAFVASQTGAIPSFENFTSR